MYITAMSELDETRSITGAFTLVLVESYQEVEIDFRLELRCTNFLHSRKIHKITHCMSKLQFCALPPKESGFFLKLSEYYHFLCIHSGSITLNEFEYLKCNCHSQHCSFWPWPPNQLEPYWQPFVIIPYLHTDAKFRCHYSYTKEGADSCLFRCQGEINASMWCWA